MFLVNQQGHMFEVQININTKMVSPNTQFFDSFEDAKAVLVGPDLDERVVIFEDTIIFVQETTSKMPYEDIFDGYICRVEEFIDNYEV